MKHTNQLFEELERCEASNFNDTLSVEGHFYNGISGAQGRECYYVLLNKLYTEFLNETGLILRDAADSERELVPIYHRIHKIADSYFDVPSQEAIVALQRDMVGVTDEASRKMKNELDRMRFFREMHETQTYFINEVIEYLKPIVDQFEKQAPPKAIEVNEIKTEETTAQEICYKDPDAEKYVYGYDGIKALMKCGDSTAAKITKILRGVGKVGGGEKSPIYLADDVLNYMKYKKITRRKNG